MVAQIVKNVPALQEIHIWSLDREDPLEKVMATRYSILAWRPQISTKNETDATDLSKVIPSF